MDGTFGDLGLLLPSWRSARREARSAPPRTTPASLARAACCASSPYSGGHVKHKIWRHLPRMPSAERREDHSLPWDTSAHKLRVTRSSAFEAAEKDADQCPEDAYFQDFLELCTGIHSDTLSNKIAGVKIECHAQAATFTAQEMNNVPLELRDIYRECAVDITFHMF